MSPELEQYIAACKAQGMDDPSIRTSLQQAGWTEEHLRAEWPVTAVPAATAAVTGDPEAVFHVPHRSMRWGRLVGIGLAVVIVLSGGLVALAEGGYAPAVSRVYRKTNLALLWHGTTADAGVALGRALLATVSEPKIKVTMSAQGTTSNLDPTAASKLGLKTVSNIGPTLADVPPASTTSTFNGSSTFIYDQGTGVQLGFAMDIPDDIRQNLDGYIKADFKSITLDAVFPIAGTTVFARTNLLPTPTQADVDKWFSYPLPAQDSVVTKREDLKTALEKTDGTARADLLAVVNATTKDQGIVRHNGLVAAWYHTLITPDVLKGLSSDTSISQSTRDALKSTADGWTGGQFTIDWYVDARSPRLIDMAIQLDAKTSYISVTEKGSVTFVFGDAATVTVPTKTWESFTAYAAAVQANQTSLFDTGAFTQAAIDNAMNVVGPSQGLEAAPTTGL